jgi:hypothetical protein
MRSSLPLPKRQDDQFQEAPSGSKPEAEFSCGMVAIEIGGTDVILSCVDTACFVDAVLEGGVVCLYAP